MKNLKMENLEITVRTQAELDAIPLDFIGSIYIDCGSEDWIQIRHNYYLPVKVLGNSSVEAYGNSAVVACDNATVKAYDDSAVMALGNSTAEAYDNADVLVYRKGRVEK